LSKVLQGRLSVSGGLIVLIVCHRFPAQEHVGGNSKIPSVVYYDKTGAVRAVGAEAFQQNVIEEAEVEGWDKVEWSALPPLVFTCG
jgi:N-formylglutamate amidohydrolase